MKLSAQIENMRISKTLHNELEKCGLGDNDLNEFNRLPDGDTTITRLNGSQTSVYVIRKVEITRGIGEITMTCP